MPPRVSLALGGGGMDRHALARLSWWNRPWISGGLVFAAVVLIYVSRILITGRALPVCGDTIPTHLLPVSLLREGNLDLDEFTELRAGRDLPYYLSAAHGHVW